VTPPAPLLLRVQEAAQALAISRTALYVLLSSGAIPAVHIGRSVRVPTAALEAYVAGLGPLDAAPLGRPRHGEGSVYKRSDGRWVAMLNVGIVAGRRKRRAFYGLTQAEAIAKLNAASHSRRRGIPVPLERQTFAAFATKWLSAARSTFREPTFRRYSSLMSRAVATLGNTSLTKLGAADLQKLYEERLSAGSAPRTVQHLHRVIHRALRDAEEWGDVARSVARLAHPPKVPRPQMNCLQQRKHGNS
jgi:excisionase family DNA binding protein